MGSFQAGMLVEQVNVTTTTGGTTTLVAATSISATLGKQNQIFTGSLGETIVLPDATTMIVGQSFNIFNQSSSALTIEFNGGGAFTDASLKNYTTLSANTSLEITLQDNTSGGTPTNVQGKWAVIASSSAGLAAAGTKNYLTAIQTSNGTNTGNGNFEFGNLTGWQWCNVGALTNGLPTGTPNFTGVNANSLYIFTISTSTTCAAGDTYTNNGQTFTVVTALSAQSGAVFYATGTGAPSSGSLSRATGSGTSSITFSSWSVSALSTVSSGQLSGSYSASLALANLNAGLGFASSTFYIDTEDQAKVLTYKLYYNVHSGASNLNLSGTSANNLAVAVYDVTNSVYLGVAGAFNFVQASGTGYATGTVQTGATTTQLAFIVYTPANQAGSATVYFDDIFIGPQTAPMGPAMTDWTSFTVTSSWTSGVTWSGWYKRVGDSAHFRYYGAVTGGVTAASLTVNLPSGMTIDSTKLGSTASTDKSYNGIWQGVRSAVNVYAGRVAIGNTTQFQALEYQAQSGTNPQPIQASTAVNASTPATWANGDTIVIEAYNVPIVGWSSNTSMSSDTDTRVVAMNANSSSNSMNYNGGSPNSSLQTSAAQVVFPTTVSDTHGAYNSTTGVYTIPVTGYYDVAASIETVGTAALNTQIILSLYNATTSSKLAEGIQTAGGAVSTGIVPSLSAKGLYLAAGTQLYIRANSNGTYTSGAFVGDSSLNYFSIARVSGPAVVAATESVNARYVFVSATAIPNASITTLNATYATYTKVRDSHAAFSAGVYTIPVSGMYRASLRLTATPTTANSGVFEAQITQAGSASTQTTSGIPFESSSALISTVASDTFYCLAGDTLTFQAYQNNSTNTISLQAATNWNSISIERVGN